MTKYSDLRGVFGEAYPELADRLGDVVLVRAPGRVNLIGEHTDYNDGLVLPVAINLATLIAFLPTADDRVELFSATTGDRAAFSLGAIGETSGSWIDYVAGVARELRAAGHGVAGLRGVVSSSVPVSAGLSSSAALELAAAWALLGASSAAARQTDCFELALVCQRAENDYVGVACGLMDQFASSCGVRGSALLLDCRSFAYETVEMPEEISIVVVDTGAKRRLAASAYNERRAQCERGVDLLRARGFGVTSLRDADVEMLEAAADELGDVVYRRCLHVVQENERVIATVAALRAADHTALQDLFAASHASLRDLYEVSSTELDSAVEIAATTSGVIASRMTGAGFGGCTVNLVEQGPRGRTRGRRSRPATDLPGGAHVTVHEVTARRGCRFGVDVAGYGPSSVPHRRYNPLRDEWVLVSPGRTDRPWVGALEPTEAEARRPMTHLLSVPWKPRAGGTVNPAYD